MLAGIKSMKRKVFLIYLIFRTVFYLTFEKASYSLPKWLGTSVLFVPVAKRSNSHFTDVYKIDTLKNLAIFTGKHLCWRFFIINFTKKRLQRRCFIMNIAKCLDTAFYIPYR